MATTFDEKIPFSSNGLEFYGLFKRGLRVRALPLVVLLHGGGATAAFFDNSVVSYDPYALNIGVLLIFDRYVKDYNRLGHDVLNIYRPGYGGTPVPTTSTPLRDSIPAFIELIEQVYNEKSAAKHNDAGIILMGHSLGGGFALSVAYEGKGRLPVIGVSSMGCLPTLKHVRIIPEPDNEPENPRYVTENTPENIKKYMGEIEWVNLDALTKELVETVFEPGIHFAPDATKLVLTSLGVKSEIREYLTKDLYEYMTEQVFPGITVPVQYLAAESEILWESEEEGQPIFSDLASRFRNSPQVDSAILPRGGHNYEFSHNASILLERRHKFVQSAVRFASEKNKSITK